jgi:glycosyltransferase involved in cell wall biosynthesis
MQKTEANSPLVSVIMPCYNAAPYLREALESVLGQTHRSVELIVVDDGSTDESLDILAQYPQVQVLRQDHRGPYPARNKGIGRARGEYVAFLDADDYWAPTFLEEMVAALQGSGAALAYCGWQNVGEVRTSAEPYVPPDYEKEGKLHHFLRGGAPWPIHAALVRTEIVRGADGFNEYLPTSMDYDLWLRIGIKHSIVRVPKVLAFYRHHDRGQITSDEGRQAINSWLVKKTFIKNNSQVFSGHEKNDQDLYLRRGLLYRGYRCYWRGDLVNARKIFRFALQKGYWGTKDLRYYLLGLLPLPVFKNLVRLARMLALASPRPSEEEKVPKKDTR